MAFELTLFTFWPPGPELRAKVNSNSSSGIDILSLMYSMESVSSVFRKIASLINPGESESVSQTLAQSFVMLPTEVAVLWTLSHSGSYLCGLQGYWIPKKAVRWQTTNGTVGFGEIAPLAE